MTKRCETYHEFKTLDQFEVKQYDTARDPRRVKNCNSCGGSINPIKPRLKTLRRVHHVDEVGV